MWIDFLCFLYVRGRGRFGTRKRFFRNEIFQCFGVSVQNGRNHRVNTSINNLVIRKPYVCLIRVNVDVHDLCRHVDIQHVKRILPFHEITHVRIGNRRGNRRINDMSSVEKHALIRFVRLGEILIPDIASDTDSVFFRVYLITFFQRRSAVNADECLFFPAAEGLENLFPVNEITKGDIRTIQNKPRDKIGNVGLSDLRNPNRTGVLKKSISTLTSVPFSPAASVISPSFPPSEDNR